MQQPDEWVAVGMIVGTFGVHGEVKVEPLSDIPGRFDQLRTVFLGDGHVPMRIEGSRLHKGHVLLKFEDVGDITSAERLRGQMLWIPASEIATLPPDQYFIHDLIGLRVEHVNGGSLGRVVDVLSGSGNDLLVIRGGKRDTESLVPAAKEFIKSVDLAAGVVLLDPIPGLFEEDAAVGEGESEA